MSTKVRKKNVKKERFGGYYGKFSVILSAGKISRKIFLKTGGGGGFSHLCRHCQVVVEIILYSPLLSSPLLLKPGFNSFLDFQLIAKDIQRRVEASLRMSFMVITHENMY